jgi:uncharacterized protein YceK
MRGSVLGALALVPLLSGCGTYFAYTCNTEFPHSHYYGGVMADVREVSADLQDAFAADDHRKLDGQPRTQSFAIGLYTLAIDLPLSAVADTLISVPWLVHDHLGSPLPSAPALPARVSEPK